MKKSFLALVSTLALVIAAQAADMTVKLSDVHICCGSCVKGVAKATADVKGLTAVASQDDETVVLTAVDKDTLQKGVDALVAAGYFGKSSDASIKVKADTGAMNMKVKTLTVKNLHLCCAKCVKAVNDILKDVKGVTGNTAAKGAESFTITGDFNDKEAMDALQKGGLTGKASM